MHPSTSKIAIVQDLATRRLEAYHARAFLWSMAPTDPGCADETAEFYTVTLIRFLKVLETSSAHQRLDLIAKSQRSGNPRSDVCGAGFLGEYPDAE